MSAANARAARCRPVRNAQSGVAAVEFAVVAAIVLMFMFGVMELARSMYMFNTLQEVTRRAATAAANAAFNDVAAMNRVRQQAIFREDNGYLLLGDPVTDAYLRIEYLALIRNADGSTTPTVIPSSTIAASTPARNRVTCTANSNDPSCIRLVRVQVCEPGATNSCAPVFYKTIFPMISFPVTLPTSTTIVPAQSLGFAP